MLAICFISHKFITILDDIKQYFFRTIMTIKKINVIFFSTLACQELPSIICQMPLSILRRLVAFVVVHRFVLRVQFARARHTELYHARVEPGRDKF